MVGLKFLVLAATIAFADGGMSTCDDQDWATDYLRVTSWKVRVTRVERNGVAVDTGTFQKFAWSNPQPISALSTMRVDAASETGTMTIGDPFLYTRITGPEFRQILERRP